MRPNQALHPTAPGALHGPRVSADRSADQNARCEGRTSPMGLEIEWDASKRRLNHLTHRVRFEEAVPAFRDLTAKIFDDPDHSDTEGRMILIGHSGNRLLVGSFTERLGCIRLISARWATSRERLDYEQAIQRSRRAGSSRDAARVPVRLQQGAAEPVRRTVGARHRDGGARPGCSGSVLQFRVREHASPVRHCGSTGAHEATVHETGRLTPAWSRHAAEFGVGAPLTRHVVWTVEGAR